MTAARTNSGAPAPAATPPTVPDIGLAQPVVDLARILVVDDEAAIAAALARFLRTRGYETETAASGDEALAMLAERPCAAALCDVRMPGMSGVEFVSLALELDADLAVLMLTGVNDAPTATDALARGAVDYLLKPVELTDLQRAIERALHKRGLLIERRRVEALIAEEVIARTAALVDEQRALRDVAVGTVETLINAMEAKDIYLRGHSERIGELAASVADELGLDADAVESVRIAGRLHDVGKIGIRESVLNKPGALTVEEFAHVKDHVRIGVAILAPLTHIADAVTHVHDHHEHWDGTGYPDGKAGSAISIGGRILAAADAFDALTSHRAYRAPQPPIVVVEYLRQHVGSLLDPRIYDALRAVVLARKTIADLFIEDI
jgi:response regulator RpfG family c-di-GMP phosphodiesterase